MAWGARVEDGKWRLCFRKGATIHFAEVQNQTVEIVFANQKKAKACADILNEKHWPRYDRAKKGKDFLPVEDRIDMVKIIRSFM